MKSQDKICFDISADNLQRLEELALAQGMDLSACVGDIVTRYLAGMDLFQEDNEKRKFPRKKVLIPAMIHTKPGSELVGSYHSTTIVDVSLGGLCISVPLYKIKNFGLNLGDAEFDIMFTFLDGEVPVSYKCKTHRVQQLDNVMHVGASFQAMDAHSLTAFRQFMTGKTPTGFDPFCDGPSPL